MMTHHLGLLLLLPNVLSTVTHEDPLQLDSHGQFFMDHGEAIGSVEPKFGESETNVTAQLGGNIFLHCPVLISGDRAISYPIISWIRLRDWHILTNGILTYTSDSRFQVLHKEGSYDWVLQIKYVQERDAGEYECQVSTSTGIISRKVRLEVVTPEAFILGGDEYHIDRGSKISLVCVIEKSPVPPQYVFWYHNDHMVNYDSDRGITVQTTKPESGEQTRSRFTIAAASPADSGNFTCKPANALPASIQVFVSEGRGDKMEALHKQNLLQSSPMVGTTSSGAAKTISGVFLILSATLAFH